ncbi:ABC transporter ATP-binding/permease protein [Butyrivibrio proteoclasticus B316]|uniref:ABC transporter ATP-binding/permease protein n=1 Tax=Butyrivibrio proteoclasticus (strain ATCC 51982 / DSM 14932 / B316) TaxID=515622 RepID=E0RX76_BUTPB|nr:ABC transporter ATP-binding protein [Butyrivibrio proteoclasticus]ADL35287.1 ABC transporter ATP-binding/permease protein [Butyrivibrio proteoclasticus B316]
MRRIFKKINILLDRKQKLQMVGIVFLMLIGGILEALGIAILAPIMQIVVDPQKVEESKYLSALYHGLNLSSTTQLAEVIMASLILVFIIKNLVLFLINVVQLRFTYTNQFATSRRMMINFMLRPYEYYLNADTSVIQRSITSDVNNMYALILSILQLTSEIIVFICLVAFLLRMDASMTLTIALLLVTVLLIIKFVIKPVMVNAGQDNQDYYSGLYKWINESVTGIKEIKIANKENYFINGYADCGAGYVYAVQKYNLYNSTPRLLIETIAVAGMIGYMLLVMMRGTSLSTLLPQLTVLMAAATRLLPSANRINNYLTSIAYFEPFMMNVTDNLQQEIHDGSVSYNSDDYRKKKEVTKLPVKEHIEMTDICYKYPNTDSYILNKAAMSIPVGKSVGIVGTSGAGKTTIVDVLLGLLKPESGKIYADGADVMQNYQGWLKNIGYIPQTIFMVDSTIRKNVAFGYPDDEIDDNKVWNALKEASLDEFVKNLPEGLDTQIGERGIRLSGGQRQRIGIARALFEDPEVLVLDEATSALDNETEAAIMDSINRLHGKKTLIIIAHRLQTIEKCDMVYRIEDGKAVRDR